MHQRRPVVTRLDVASVEAFEGVEKLLIQFRRHNEAQRLVHISRLHFVRIARLRHRGLFAPGHCEIVTGGSKPSGEAVLSHHQLRGVNLGSDR